MQLQPTSDQYWNAVVSNCRASFGEIQLQISVMKGILCYNDANNLIETLTYYNVLTTATTLESFNDYVYPHILSEFRLPKGTTSIVPKVVISQVNMNYSVNDVQMMIMCD